MAKRNTKRAAELNEQGLEYYHNWQLEDAVSAFKDAAAADAENPEYDLNLARVLARSGRYDDAMTALGAYLSKETRTDIASRFERMFSTALDDVETVLIEKMKEMELPMQQIGKAMQMWLEYRITIGRKTLRTPKPALWAAALTNTIAKINFVQIRRQEVADIYGVSDRSLKEKCDDLVETLDLMPADYRYFTGENNPLDKLVEAAQLLEELDRQFRAD